MNHLRILLICFIFGLVSSELAAQEDNWWRRLFKRETVEKQKENLESDSTNIGEIPPIDSAVNEINVPDDDLYIPAYPTSGDGRVRVNSPEGLTRLDSSFRESPPILNGYRIQIYFGDLGSAREYKKEFMAEIPDMPCYLVQNPPNFSVLIGDYRTQLDAYRESLLIKADYPTLTIVQSPISPPAFRSKKLE